jgi:hypothetical protein
MYRRIREVLLVSVWLALTPALAHAQASITGSVRDTSGAVLPGVTVEAASPALIEKVRAGVTDGTGQYRIENLRPGLYTVTFTLAGFSTVKREGLELAGTFTATVNAELRVGTLEETITVTGESPVVDVQSTTRQRVMNREILDTIPSGGTALALGVLIPGAQPAAGQNVGGLEVRTSLGGSLSIHGGGGSQTTISGVNFMSLSSGASTATVFFNPVGLQEITIDTAAVSAELEAGGVRVNYVPRDGGNTFSGTFIGAFANRAMQGSNFTQALRDRGLSTPNALNKMWDVNPGFGGPIKRDRLWFFGAARHVFQSQYATGLFYNRNFNNPDAWTFDPDPSRPVTNDTTNPDGQLRFAWQATPRHKIGLLVYRASFCFCPSSAGPTLALEASGRTREYPRPRVILADWTFPITNRLLFEASGDRFTGSNDQSPLRGLNPAMIGVTEQSTDLTYRAGSTYYKLPEGSMNVRVAVSYITGAHALKIGMNQRSGHMERYSFDLQPLSYRFNNGIPNQLTERAYPFTLQGNIDHDLGLFVQDKWSLEGLTFSYGLRYDYYAGSTPEQHIGPVLLAPTRDITVPAEKNVATHDLSPKLGAAYDPFGTGKTALKVSLNRYVATLGPDGTQTLAGRVNPVLNLVTSTTRSWTDTNRNFVPDCDLINPNANGECGRMANTAFGGVRPGATYDVDLLRGWGVRNYNWEFSAGVQQELVPQVSAEVSYFRRWFGNFDITDDLAISPADFDQFSVPAPRDPRLPAGGGYVISGLYNLNPAKFGVPADNFVTRASNYGKQIEYWQGVDVTVNARPRPGALLQGGLSTGRTVTDRCEILAKLPEINPVGLPYCRVVPAFLTQVKFLGSYTIPRVDVQVSGTLQSLPGSEILANYNAPNALVVPSLGRSLSGNAANVTVNLVPPGTMYGERFHQLDVRFSKLLRFGRTRTRVNVDVFNAANSSAVLTQNNSFGAWQRPTRIMPARFVKVGAQFDF